MPFKASRLVLLSLLLCVVGSPALAQRPKKSSPSREKYVVMDVGGELKVLASKEAKSLPKQIDQDHKEAVKSWTEAKKAASKAKEKFTDKKPVKPKLKKLAGPFKSEADAEKALNKLRASRSKPARSGKATWTVVEVGDERRAVLKSETAALKKSADADYREAVKAWTKAKAEARKAKEPFEEKKPVKTAVKDLKKSFPTEDAAKEWIASGKKS